MGLYIDNANLQKLKNHIVKISHKEFSCSGILNDDSTSYQLGTNLTDSGSIAMGDSLADKSLNSFDNAVNSMMPGNKLGKIAGNALRFGSDLIKHNNLTQMTEAYSVTKPKGWQNPQITFTVVFYEGLNVGYDTPNYNTFMKQLAQITLPSTIAGVMHSKQVSWETYLKLYAMQATSGIANFKKDIINSTFKINIGQYFSSGGGWWLTDAKVANKNMFDQNGHPVVWTIDFTFQYYKQITADEWASFFL